MGNKATTSLSHTTIERQFLHNKLLSDSTASLVAEDPQKVLHVMSYNILADRLTS